ncbi:MAG: tol-pal system protein YbgF [Desulfobacterales bacterium]|nr:tol-pal system protein YbgF [Desulfobacterales bacterium]MBS3756627.1 tol-pal system protein YbgF [Desulfobacterales bacterium]
MHKIFVFPGVLVLAGLMLMGSGCATNADVHQLRNRLAKLEKRNQVLNASIDRLNNAISGDKQKRNDIRELFASQDAAFDELKSELRKLRGNFEETEYRISKDVASLRKDLDEAGKRIDENAEDLEYHDKRLSRLETFMGMETTDKFEALAESRFPDKAELENLTEEELYGTAKQAYDNGEYQTAVQGFELFLEKFPDSKNADNARFWIGEVYFAEKWYEKAILEYENVIKNYPEGNKVRGAYLKQGMAFAKLGENANARLILQTLIQKYPDSDEAEIARKKLASMK